MSKRGRGGGDVDRAPAPGWRERLADPDEALYTTAVASELLGLDPQSLRRLGGALDHQSDRPSGNQRRYSRNDLELLDRAAQLSREGHSGNAIGTIIELQDRLERLEDGADPPATRAR